MPITPEMTARLVKKPYPQTAKALADKWGPIFGVDPAWIVSHCYVESSCNPLDFNPRGNAWGMMQIKPPTAADIIRWMKAAGASKDPRVKTVLEQSWRGQGEDLFNPELNVMLGTYYIKFIARKMKERFGRDDHEIVAAAYNQGPGAVGKAMRTGEFLPTGEMRKYIAMIEKAKEDHGLA